MAVGSANGLGAHPDYSLHDVMRDVSISLRDATPTLTGSAVPKMATSYAGSLTETGGSGSYGSMHGHEVYDESSAMRVMAIVEDLPFNGTENRLNITTILASNASFLEISGRCQPLPDKDKFAPMWGWLKYAKQLGNMTIDNRPCNLYGLEVPTQNLTMSVCIDAVTGRVPVSFNISMPSYSADSIYGPDIHEGLTPSDKEMLKIPDRCSEKPPICDGGEASELDVFIFHPANQFDLDNENVADLRGDTAFICLDAISGHTAADAYQWVSRYTLQVWSGWGDYGECNRPSPHEPGECISFEDFAVGREASFGFKASAGQCSNNSDIGSWFSLPRDGMCQNDTQVLGVEGDGHCSWRVLEKVKTINGSCLLTDQGMLDSCISEATMPFVKTESVLLSAFTETDPSKGGCPDISPK